MVKKKIKPAIDDEKLEAAAEELAPVYEEKSVPGEPNPGMYDWSSADLEPYLSEVNSEEDIRQLINKEYAGLREGKPVNWRLFVILGLIGILKEL